MFCGSFPVTLQLWRNWAAERAHWSLSFYSCYTHLLMGLIFPFPLLPCPCLHFHISLSSSVSSHHLILSLWGADKNRERETQKDKEKAKEDKNKLETNRNQKKDLSKTRGLLFLSNLKAFVIIGPCLSEQTLFGQLIRRENMLQSSYFSFSPSFSTGL